MSARMWITICSTLEAVCITTLVIAEQLYKLSDNKHYIILVEGCQYPNQESRDVDGNEVVAAVGLGVLTMASGSETAITPRAWASCGVIYDDRLAGVADGFEDGGQVAGKEAEDEEGDAEATHGGVPGERYADADAGERGREDGWSGWPRSTVVWTPC